MQKLTIHQLANTGLTPIGDGASSRRFVKDLIRVGEYVHPLHKWRLSVTPDRLNKWQTRFNLAKAAGATFEVTKDHGQGAADVIGRLVDVYVDGDRLMGVHEFADDECAKIASRCQNVSVEIHPNYKLGEVGKGGNEFGEMVFKSSVVQQPVVPGQLPFIAASIGGEQASEQHLWLSTELSQGQSNMDYSKLSEALGETVTDEASLLAAIAKLKGKGKETPSDPAMLSMQAEINRLRRATVTASVEGFFNGIKGKVPAGKIETAKPKLLAIVAGTDTDPGVLCMSVAGKTETPASELLAVLGDLYADVKPLADVKQMSLEQNGKPAPTVSALEAAVNATSPHKFGV